MDIAKITTRELLKCITPEVLNLDKKYKLLPITHDQKRDLYILEFKNNDTYYDAYIQANNKFVEIINKRTQEAEWCMNQVKKITDQLKDALVDDADKKTINELDAKLKQYLICAGNHHKEINKLKEQDNKPFSSQYQTLAIQLEIKRVITATPCEMHINKYNPLCKIVSDNIDIIRPLHLDEHSLTIKAINIKNNRVCYIAEPIPNNHTFSCSIKGGIGTIGYTHKDSLKKSCDVHDHTPGTYFSNECMCIYRDGIKFGEMIRPKYFKDINVSISVTSDNTYKIVNVIWECGEDNHRIDEFKEPITMQITPVLEIRDKQLTIFNLDVKRIKPVDDLGSLD